MPSNTRYPNIQFIKPKKEDYDDVCCPVDYEEDTKIFRQSRSDSPMGEWMREVMGLDR